MKTAELIKSLEQSNTNLKAALLLAKQEIQKLNSGMTETPLLRIMHQALTGQDLGRYGSAQQ